jgi:hypothetical protein
MRLPNKRDETEHYCPMETMNSNDGLATILIRSSSLTSGNYSNDFDEMTRDSKNSIRSSQASNQKQVLDSARKSKIRTPFITNSYSGSLKSIDLQENKAIILSK